MDELETKLGEIRTQFAKLGPDKLPQMQVIVLNRSQRDKNPGNLRFAGQKEAVGKDDKNFAIFPTHMAGWRALFNQVALDQKRGDTVETFIKGYAPSSENDTESYIKFVCQLLRVSRDTPLKNIDKRLIAMSVAIQEGYFNT